MPKRRRSEKGRVFTVELHSSSDVRNVLIPNGAHRILIEGTIGTLKHAEFVENTILELTGTRGILRVDLAREDLSKPSSKYQEGVSKK